MSSLLQLQLAYNQLEDRLLLTLQTQDFCEYQFWITRNLVTPLWNILQQLLRSDKEGSVRRKQESRQIAKKIQEEKKQHQATADKLGTHIAKHPLGNQPLLLASVMGQQNEQGTFLLTLNDIRGNSLRCSGDSLIVAALCQLTLQTIQSANWNLSLNPD